MSHERESGGGCLLLLTVIFVALKLGGVIDWSWWAVTAPLWVPFLIAAGSFAIVALIWVIGKLTFARNW